MSCCATDGPCPVLHSDDPSRSIDWLVPRLAVPLVNLSHGFCSALGAVATGRLMLYEFITLHRDDIVARTRDRFAAGRGHRSRAMRSSMECRSF